jgi:hypothetical protein
MWTHANVDGQVDLELLRLQGRMRQQNYPLPTVSSPEMDAMREVSGQRFQAVERLEAVVSVVGQIMRRAETRHGNLGR